MEVKSAFCGQPEVFCSKACPTGVQRPFMGLRYDDDDDATQIDEIMSRVIAKYKTLQSRNLASFSFPLPIISSFFCAYKMVASSVLGFPRIGMGFSSQ